MAALRESVRHWPSATFSRTLKDELRELPAGVLPLSAGTRQGGQIDEHDRVITVLAVQDREGSILARIGVFFTETVGGCSCGDEPFDEPAYCELRVTIDKATGEALFTPI